MGLLAQLFGWGRTDEVRGEIAYARFERMLRLAPEDRRRVACAYIGTYAEEAFSQVVETRWEEAADTYTAGAGQIPDDLLRDVVLADFHAVLTYNALIARVAANGMTTSLRTELEERLWPPRGLFAKRPEPIPSALMTRAAIMVLASYEHLAGQFETASERYAQVASPTNTDGRSAALRLRLAANHRPLPTGASVPAFFRPRVIDAGKGLALRIEAPVPLVMDRSGQETVVHVELSTLERGMQFEEKCLQLVRAMGIVATTTAKTGDGGVDIVGFSHRPLLEGTLVIQCKDWREPVGESVVRDLYGVTSARQAMKGICITSGSFTRQARKFAETLPIELIDGATLDYWLARYLERGTDETAEVAAGEDSPVSPLP